MGQVLSRLGAAALIAFTAMSLPSRAGEIADAGAKAEQAMETGDPVAAVNALDEAMEAIWKASPLVFRKALLVDSGGGFGIYVEREDATYKPGEAIIAYAEPVGFAYGKNSIGGTEIGLIVDFVLENTGGEVLFSKDEFATIGLPVRYHNREFQMTVTVNLTGLGEGDYVAKFHIRDKHSDKAGDFDLLFKVRS